MVKILITLSVLPIIVILLFIFLQDRFQEMPFKTLSKAVLGGLLVFPLDLGLGFLFDLIWKSDTVFYSAFWETALPKELSIFIIFMILIWRDRYFHEYKDGVVYATLIGLIFACIENLMYIYDFGGIAFGITPWSCFSRVVLTTPAYFLFGMTMGFCFSLARLHHNKTKRLIYLVTGPILAIACHSLFEWLIMAATSLEKVIVCIIYIVFIVADIFLWLFGLKYIRKREGKPLRKLKDDSHYNTNNLKH